MKNRVAQNPGRVLITPEDGTTPYYATVTRADNPTDAGDPISKETFLQDSTAERFDLPNTAVPNDVFNRVPMPELTVYDTDGAQITCSHNDVVLTDTVVNGKCVLTLPYYGLWTVSNGDKQEYVSANKAGQLFLYMSYPFDYTGNFKLYDSNNNIFALLSSGVLTPKADIVADMFLAGGGGGGGGTGIGQSNYHYSGGAGGGGGYTKSFTTKLLRGTNYDAVIGAGGAGGAYHSNPGAGNAGARGGTTSFVGQEALGGYGGAGGNYYWYSDAPSGAKGGNGGCGGGGATGGSRSNTASTDRGGDGGTDGGNGKDAVGTQHGYGGTGQGTTTTAYWLYPMCGGGGGSCSSGHNNNVGKGYDGGGDGTSSAATSSTHGKANTGGGGGGAGSGSSLSGGNGGSGVILLKIIE